MNCIPCISEDEECAICEECAVLQNEDLVALPLKRSPSKIISATWALEGYLAILGGI